MYDLAFLAAELTVVGYYIGIMQKKMETTIVYWGYIGLGSRCGFQC